MAITFNPTMINDNTPKIDIDYLKNVSFANMTSGINFNANVQGCALINLAFFASLSLQLKHINGCAELQKQVDKAMVTVNAEIASIEAEIAELLPMLGLLEIPTNPLKWIADFINHILGPMLAPYTKYLAQLEQTIAQVVEVAAVVEAAAEVIEGGCSINIPLQFPGCLGVLIAGATGNPPKFGIHVEAPEHLIATSIKSTEATIDFIDPGMA